MALKIKQDQVRLIENFGEKGYPDECCGFLLGTGNGTGKEVVDIMPASNQRENSERYHRFTISPQDYMKCEKYAREHELEIIGFYHSHPDHPARPSDYDREHGWPWYSYIIVSVKEQKAAEMTSWILQDDREKFNEEEIVVE